ncbi:L-lactate permease [Nevskia soli]|uniref:L-lactate permease n=1 Tax=Nevskia soli TaxID=418856 RepID=UPI0004A702CE|nr:L-lactate permease [Nevskia soli]
MFNQVLDPLGNMAATAAVALVPLAVLLLLLVWLRRTAWLAAMIGSVVTFLLAWLVWGMPLDSGARSYFYGSLNGAWAVDWITFWGLMLFNTLVITGRFERLRAWLVSQGTLDVRIQTLLFAWAFGALLEGLVGFGYPWAVVAPLLISLRIPDIDAIRVAAIANNAPVSYGALGAPIIALAAVTGLPLLDLSASVGYVVAVLALLPPWILIYLVSGRAGLRDGWPLAIVGSLAYVAGQLPVAVYLGPYLPDVTGSIVCFIALLALIKVWRPKTVLGYGGVPVSQADIAAAANRAAAPSAGEVFGAWLPFLVLIVVVVAWTGPWSSLPKISWLSMKVEAISSVTQKPISSAFDFKPYVGGTAIFASWLVVIALLRPSFRQLREIFAKTAFQIWGAALVGVFVFGLAYVYNYSGMAASLASALSHMGLWFIVFAPILGMIGVALSGSNTSTNAMFGAVQMLVGKLLGLPPLLLPTLNSVGAEVGKPIAPQTCSVGVATTKFVRNEGEVIRHNFAWTLAILAWLLIIGVGRYLMFS